MTCPDVERIARLADGQVPEDEARNLREHLDACEACAAALHEMDDIWASLTAWPAPAAPDDLSDRIVQAAMQEATRPRSGLIRFPWVLRVAASIIAATGLGIATGGLLTGQRPREVHGTTLDGIERAVAMLEMSSESPTGLPLGLDPADPQTEEEPS